MLTKFVSLLALSTVAMIATQSFPVIGATYQLDRAKYPGRVAICTTEKAMGTYIAAEEKRDQATLKRLIRTISTNRDIEAMKKTEACTLVSSASQAKVVQKGVEAHKAEFAAFPFLQMWGHHSYFGGRAR